MMKRNPLKILLKQGLEVILVVTLVLGFFAGIYSLLNLVFPSGTSLRELMSRSGTGQVEGPVQPRRQIVQDGEELQPLELRAVLAQVRNTVKSKRAEAIAWHPAEEGDVLYTRDAVQTLDSSRAQIRFDESNLLNLEENSLVILREFGRDPLRRRNRSVLVLLDGQMRGQASPAEQQPTLVEVEMPNAVATFTQPAAAGGADTFLVTVNPDKSSTIAVYQGVAEVTAQGKTVKVEKNQATTVAPDMPPEVPRELPARPWLSGPEEGREYRFRDLPPRVEFSWKPVAVADKYRLVLARDADFKQPVLEEVLKETGFVHGNLPQGTYYWKVTGLNGRVEGLPSVPHRVTLVQDRQPPALDVKFPPQVMYMADCSLQGRTEPGARIYVDGREVGLSPAGEFDHPLKLQAGLNVLVVEAVDGCGNVSYQSRKVDGKF